MSTITSRQGHAAFESGPETGFRDKEAILQGAARRQASDRSSESMAREQAHLVERRAAAAAAALAAAVAASNSGGLGASAEEITFGTSERAELETHDESRDARDRKEERIEALMRIDAIHALMRQIAGEQEFASIRQRAERFARLWAEGKSRQAMDELDTDAFAVAERQALLTLALDKLPLGADAAPLNARLRELELDGDGDEGGTVRRLMRTAAAADASATAKGAFAPGSPLLAVLQSPPTPKLVLEAAGGLGRDGLQRLEALAVPRHRVDVRLTRGGEVFLSLTLLRMIQQVRQVEQSGIRMMRAGAAGPCPGADDPEEVRKTARWILDTTLAPAPQGAMARMETVFKVRREALSRVRREMQRELDKLPAGVWLNGDTKQIVSTELKNFNKIDLVQQGRLNRNGLTCDVLRAVSAA
jgi:hypothetical protein